LNLPLLQELARLDAHSRKTGPCPQNLSRPARRCLEVHKVCLYAATARIQAKLIALVWPVWRHRAHTALRHQLHATSAHLRLPTNLVPHQVHSSAGGPRTVLTRLAVYAASGTNHLSPQHAFSGPGTHCPASARPHHDSSTTRSAPAAA
jgi:hypothetical protein